MSRQRRRFRTGSSQWIFHGHITARAASPASLGAGWNHSLDLELLNINEPDALLKRLAFKDETGSIFLV